MTFLIDDNHHFEILLFKHVLGYHNIVINIVFRDTYASLSGVHYILLIRLDFVFQ